ncbi:hypothetical protein LXL04_029082 [Taraxacum kok-saghyz]
MPPPKPWDRNVDQLIGGVIDEPLYNDDDGRGYVDDMQQMEGFLAESLTEVYYANGYDLNLTIKMLTRLELYKAVIKFVLRAGITMGIQGLLPLMKSVMVPIHIKDLEGCSVDVDTYSWLHKGALSCSMELCKSQPTSKYTSFLCSQYIGKQICSNYKFVSNHHVLGNNDS